MVFSRKSRDYVRDNVTFGFAKESDFKSFEELRAKAVKDGRKHFLDWFPEREQLKDIEREQAEFQKAAEGVKNLIRRGQRVKANRVMTRTQFGKSIILVAKDKGRVIGFQEIMLGLRPLIKFNYVLPKYRRSGIASSFHGLSQLITAEAGYKSIEAGHPINKAAIRALDKAGLPHDTKRKWGSEKFFRTKKIGVTLKKR